jgi:hypothetical protein
MAAQAVPEACPAPHEKYYAVNRGADAKKPFELETNQFAVQFNGVIIGDVFVDLTSDSELSNTLIPGIQVILPPEAIKSLRNHQFAVVEDPVSIKTTTPATAISLHDVTIPMMRTIQKFRDVCVLHKSIDFYTVCCYSHSMTARISVNNTGGLKLKERHCYHSVNALVVPQDRMQFELRIVSIDDDLDCALVLNHFGATSTAIIDNAFGRLIHCNRRPWFFIEPTSIQMYKNATEIRYTCRENHFDMKATYCKKCEKCGELMTEPVLKSIIYIGAFGGPAYNVSEELLAALVPTGRSDYTSISKEKFYSFVKYLERAKCLYIRVDLPRKLRKPVRGSDPIPVFTVISADF